MKEQQAQAQNTEISQKIIIPEKITKTQIKKAEPEKKSENNLESTINDKINSIITNS